MLRNIMSQLSWAFALMAVSFSISAQEKVVVIPMAGDDAYVVRSGQTLTGVISYGTQPGDDEIQYVPISFASPLPEGTPQPILGDVADGCTGPGVAGAGYICFYLDLGGNVAEPRVGNYTRSPHYRYGLNIGFIVPNPANRSYGRFSWAYRVP